MKDRVTRTPLKTGGEIRCSGRVSSSCSTSDIHTLMIKKIEKPNDLEIFGSKKPKGLNSKIKPGEGRLCIREENLSFIKNYMNYEQ